MKPILLESIGSFELPDMAHTLAAAAYLAAKAQPGDVIALWGDLGVGKTTFARGFIGALSPVQESVPSPTFTLAQTYPAEPAEIWHFDLYRLKAPEEAYELGIEDAFAAGISLIEWPDRLGPLLPRERLDVTLAPGTTSESRRLSLAGSANWKGRITGLGEMLRGRGIRE